MAASYICRQLNSNTGPVTGLLLSRYCTRYCAMQCSGGEVHDGQGHKYATAYEVRNGQVLRVTNRPLPFGGHP